VLPVPVFGVEGDSVARMNTSINGGEAVVATLRDEGITHVFGIVASSILEIFNLLPLAGLEYIGVRHEQVAAHMADGYARILRRPAACLAQNGGGVTNLATGLGTALKAHSPVVAISGTPTTGELDRDTFQELDQLAVMRPVTKWCARVPRSDRIAEYIRRAVSVASTPPMGPTFVEIPRDFLYEMNQVVGWRPSEHAVDALVVPNQQSLSVISKAAQAAERPVIVAGGGVVWADGSQEVMRLAKRLRAPVATSYQHNDAADSDMVWSVGSLGRAGSKYAMECVKESDCLIVVGSRLDRFSVMPYWGVRYFPVEAPIYQVDIDPARIGSNWPVEFGVVADAREFAASLTEHVPEQGGASKWSEEELRSGRAKWREEFLSWSDESRKPLQMEYVFDVLSESLPPECVIVTDVGATPSYAFHRLDYPSRRSLVAPMLLGSLGFGLGAAMGASVATSDRPVICLLGDGAFTMSLPALVTAAEYGLTAVFIVFDNACWGAEKVNQTYFNAARYVGTLLKNPDLADVARSLGCNAFSVNEGTALADAVAASLRSDGPSVIVVKVDPDSLPQPARKDALAIPERGLFVE
jgi:sulfoacetaldehyde acetyltransferase